MTCKCHDLYRDGALALILALTVTVAQPVSANSFIRGDSDANGALEVTDPARVFGFLFLGNPVELGCHDAADTDDSGFLDISDGIYALNFLFTGGSQPAAPYPDCGEDPTPDDLDCAEFSLCDAAPAGCSEDLPGFTFLTTNAQGYSEYTHDGTGIVFVCLPGGEFEMGSPDTEPNRETAEGPVHTVTLSPFLIAKYECTQAEYEAVMAGHASLSPTPSRLDGTTDGHGRAIDPPLDRDQLPVEQVSWDDLHEADGFLARTGLSLPTEAQWEYAARGGTRTAFSFGDDCNQSNCDPCSGDAYMWHCRNSRNTTHPVGEKLPNPFGLHDMHGNALEWCEDVLNWSFYGTAEAAGPDPVSTSGSPYRVLRGGGFFSRGWFCRLAHRGGFPPFVCCFDGFGFRPVWRLPCAFDDDGDGILDCGGADNCPNDFNPDQVDLDMDGIGLVCDEDHDGDQIPSDDDNCPDDSNFEQADFDEDGIGDVCDEDRDGDVVRDVDDNCPWTPNPDQEDTLANGFGDACNVFGDLKVPDDLTFLRTNSNSGLQEFVHVQTGIEVVLLPGGEFEMGSPDTEPVRDTDEGPVHTVTLSPFLIAKYEVKQAEYAAVMGSNPSHFTGDDQRPVESVSWSDLHASGGFLERAGALLPSEAQWEYACRGGTTKAFSFPARYGPIVDLWYRDNSGETTHPVGEKLPNPFGLHDMHGNVEEWCEDLYNASYYGTAAAVGPDPVSTTGSGLRVIRGGSWINGAGYCRSAIRDRFPPGFRYYYLGFRPVWRLP